MAKNVSASTKMTQLRGLTDTGEVMDKKEKKEVNIEIMENESAAVKTMKIISIGLPTLMSVVVIYRPIRIINTPGVAGAFLQSPPLLIKSSTDSFIL